MSPEQQVAMVAVGVKLAFEQAAESFLKNPGPENYTRLTDSALAYQYWVQCRKEKIAFELIRQPVMTWTERLKATAESEFNGA